MLAPRVVVTINSDAVSVMAAASVTVTMTSGPFIGSQAAAEELNGQCSVAAFTTSIDTATTAISVGKRQGASRPDIGTVPPLRDR